MTQGRDAGDKTLIVGRMCCVLWANKHCARHNVVYLISFNYSLPLIKHQIMLVLLLRCLQILTSLPLLPLSYSGLCYLSPWWFQKPNCSPSLNSWPFPTVSILLLEWYFYVAYLIMLLSCVKKIVNYMSSLLDCELMAGTGPLILVFSHSGCSVFV